MWSQGSRARIGRIVEAISQAASIASFLWISIPLIVPLAGAIIGFSFGHQMIGAFAGGAISMLLVVALLLMFPLRPMMRRLFYGFRFESVEITLDLDADGPKQHKRHSAFKAKIVRTGIRSLPDHYCAPGPGVGEGGVAEPKTSTHGQLQAPITISRPTPGPPQHAPRVIQGDARILGPLYDPPNEFWIYEMDLGASLSSGSEREIRLVQDLDFRSVEYGPRLQRTIIDPTDHLLLALRLPENQWPIGAEGEEILPGNRPKKIPVSIDQRTREVRLEVNKPRFGSIYRIRWSPVGPKSPLDTAELATIRGPAMGQSNPETAGFGRKQPVSVRGFWGRSNRSGKR
jgi:hypothetical protein